MSFVKDRLADPSAYFESEGVTLIGRGRWRTARCDFHGGSDSMRINTETGAWVCMAGCGARGGDVLAYHMATHGVSFVEAAKALGAWEEDGKHLQRRRPTTFPPRDALYLLRQDATLAAVAAGNLARGVALSAEDRDSLMRAARRITLIASEVEE
ncbi:CHC2 zinc finger domain-containing protein [Variovorax sp. J22G73]|uniref:CHC2 zinc finger domain-containing protein n=1 Tax=unclassified Variovorax TaxID=663243 RepID=UPI00257511BD|nr:MULTISPECIES: CHC2 zinc finger domain-containing protein [unclassified Variovorax]MDM0007882.1 CHC2 zinc finger domain-containing protein [Variovorax sp. J22R203]MDM0100495.1 CHC2 zinc finger domain-containing protein [Variovorax sp. J22G73]